MSGDQRKHRESPAKHGKTTVGDYLIRRLGDAGVGHVFGVPGDYVLGFCDKLVASPLALVGTCTEAGAAFAADGYARVRGAGAICVTYAVGGLNCVNAVAGAYAEKSPVILVSGAPGTNERARSPLLHHVVRDFDVQRRVFEKITAAAVVLDDPATAPDRIDEAIATCLRRKRPVYIELPRDMNDAPCRAPGPLSFAPPPADPDALAEAVAEAAGMLRAAKRPAILAGVEIHRFGLQDALLALAERAGFPMAATLLGKSVVSERHPQYLGVYEGAMGRESVRKAIESADCLLALGTFMTDINLGGFTARLDPARTIHATSERIRVRHHSYDDVPLRDFIEGLEAAKLGPRRKIAKPARRAPKPFEPRPSEPISVARFFERLDDYVADDSIVVADVGDSLFGAAGLTIHKRTEFLSPAFYTSMGFAIPAALGAQLARPELRPIVVVGDGAFQMTCQELSTVARLGLNPIVLVLNNKGYTTERHIAEGPYNDIREWSYHRWPEIVQAGWGLEVASEGALEAALNLALNNTRSLSIVNVHLDKMDRSEALGRLGETLRARAGAGSAAARKKPARR